MQLFNFTSPSDQCTCAIALCKEPSEEYCQYLRVMVDEGVDLERYDEQGYSALDYAVFAGNEQMQDIVSSGLAKTSHLDSASITQQLDGAHLKKHYKEVFQEHLRPELSRGGDSIQRMRIAYNNLLSKDPVKKQLFDELKFVRYSDFVKHGRLPSSMDNLTQTYAEASRTQLPDTFDPYIVFISYRWIGTSTIASHNLSAPSNPDDAQHTQYRRMLDTIQDFLVDSEIAPDRLCIWLDWACIDQTNKDPGINALPVNVTQCNAMISLTDDTYFRRAWCALECSMIQTLVSSHGQHLWYTHKLQAPGTDRVFGHLERCLTRVVVHPAQMPLSVKSDRPKIAFLHKQSILLGKETV
ncbi:hypothetical protein NKR19_g2977 [Coniochaeta hoffmannii]|uniref:Heterokaryon incompatibility domain-containing protein n=1 Tax=Coniochaeta hoffmannii TaxID=91930 RepID=A0AA38SHL9_9PEZI|nr:hypothetical protein NKR19_g2977 [Coniochaeta hoffmannii]